MPVPDRRRGRTAPLARGLAAVTAAALGASPVLAYPLNGQALSGIRRLQGDATAQRAPIRGERRLPPGALLGVEDLRLHLADVNPDFDLAGAPQDPQLRSALEAIVKERDPSYALVVVDLTDPGKIVWAGVREHLSYYPGSVGKVLCMIALFDGLRRAFPDPAEREHVLRETWVEATDWAAGDSHRVPVLEAESGRNRWRSVARGDRFTLAEWVDHMVSPSANAAGSMVWREAMLLREFGRAYPPGREQLEAFLRTTPAGQLAELSRRVIDEPLAEAGIDTAAIRQGTLWTARAQARVPGIGSHATPRELARILLRIEQGRMVDRWSSLEMKRYLYMTKKRYRYAYAPELHDAAVYFKSGSLYRCQPEPGFVCGKYRGNVENEMNSAAIVESPACGPDQKRYLVALMSNVLRRNSAWDHARIAAAIEQAVRTRRPVRVKDEGSAEAVADAGRGD